MESKTSVITIDVEDGVNLGMRDLMGVKIPPTKRVVNNTTELLDLFERNNVKGTFFVLGQVAESYPNLVKQINNSGHEIGVHGYDHFRFYNMDYETAKDQLYRARMLLQDLTGQEVIGHRAPAFSINNRTKWALHLLAELGFKYDSSIMPCSGPSYGWESFNKGLTKFNFPDGKYIYEFPLSVVNLLGKDVPCLGGSYLRLLPYWISKITHEVVSKERSPIVYIHPYEIDEVRYPYYFFDALGNEPIKTKARVLFMRLNRKSVKKKINKLLSINTFVTMESMLNNRLEKNEKLKDWHLSSTI